MQLSELLQGTGAERVAGKASGVDATGVASDSRKVKPGDVFVAVPGAAADGSEYAQEAVKAGAVALVAERKLDFGVPCFVVGSARRAAPQIAANFYRHPAKELALLGVTGTNGKTTTALLIEAMAAAGGAAVGVIGTLGHRFAGQTREATHTTPDGVELQRLLREMVDAGCDTVVMEVSSHALVQDRVEGLTFRAAAFTNLSRDHLDYHKDLEDYFQAKRRLFTQHLSTGGVAIVNGDDTQAARIYNELRGDRRMAWKFSRQGAGEISVAGVELTLEGIKGVLKTPAGDVPLRSELVGAHNLENILAAAGVALGAGMSRRDVQDGISRVRGVSGRMEKVEDRGVVGLVDYAHTDEALRRALEALRPVTKGRLWVIFGCGGDRDRGKRPLMGQAAAEGADVIVVTSDNPRSEPPEDIIAEIVPGIEKTGLRRASQGKVRSGERGYLVEEDRKAAIDLVASLVKADDVVLLAGKGHERHQQIRGEQRPFDDRAELERALKARSA